jgi:hypothetical protein
MMGRLAISAIAGVPMGIGDPQTSHHRRAAIGDAESISMGRFNRRPTAAPASTVGARRGIP